jgi:FkbM family methyltransferase
VSKINSAIETLRDRGAPALCKAVWGIARTAGHRMTGRHFALCRVYDYRLWVDLDDRGISRTLMLFGERELEHKAMLERIVEPGMRIFDIGANIGYYAIMESQLVGPSGQVVAIEPSPENVTLLRRNLEHNAVSNVAVREGAISDEKGEREFHLSTQSNLNTFHNVGSGAVHLAGESIPVEVSTVPALTEEFGPPDVMRMDVEGHEVEVIRGLLDAVEAGTMRPKIIFETHLSRYTADHDFEPVLRRLFAAGYEVSLAASSWERGTEVVETFGYRGVEKIRSDGVIRTLFESISADDAVKLICETGGLRTVILSPVS